MGLENQDSESDNSFIMCFNLKKEEVWQNSREDDVSQNNGNTPGY